MKCWDKLNLNQEYILSPAAEEDVRKFIGCPRVDLLGAVVPAQSSAPAFIGHEDSWLRPI